MKKLVVLILALCMLCSVAFANELTWASVEEAASQIAGEFKTFDEISVKIWIPEVLQAVELSDEDRESGYIGYLSFRHRSRYRERPARPELRDQG